MQRYNHLYRQYLIFLLQYRGVIIRKVDKKDYPVHKLSHNFYMLCLNNITLCDTTASVPVANIMFAQLLKRAKLSIIRIQKEEYYIERILTD